MIQGNSLQGFQGSIPTTDNIEVIELDDIDLDQAVAAAMAPVLTTADAETSQTYDATELEEHPFFKGVELQQFADRLQGIQTITMGPGYVLSPAGQLDSKVYFVLEGQLRLHPETVDNKPFGVVDVGYSVGLNTAVEKTPVNVIAVAAEHTRVVALDIDIIDDLVANSHVAAQNYVALLTQYMRSESYISLGLSSGGSSRGNRGFIDEVTGLHNGRWLEKMLPRYVSRCAINELQLAIVMFEIDKFRVFRKEHGDDIARRYLAGIGRVIIEKARVTDLSVRQDEHRFLVILPDSDVRAARSLARRINDVVKKARLIIGRERRRLDPLTLSMGIAQIDGPMTDLELLEKAEKLMLQAKNVGGNWIAE